MKVVIVSEGPCYPPNAGNRLRTLHLMVRLARDHDITHVCRAHPDAKETLQMQAHLHDHGIQTVVVDDPPERKHGAGFYLRLGMNLLSSVPFSVTAHNSLQVQETLRRLAASEAIDLWQFEWLAYSDALRAVPGARRLIIAHDVVSLLWQRHHETELNALKRWYIRQQWHKFQRYERRLYNEATRVVAVSPEDAERIQRLYGVDTVDVVENGVDNAFFAETRGERNPYQILYVGTLESRPNLDAVRLLLDQVFPEVRAREANAKVCIVGRNPPDWLIQRVQQEQGVELHGNVPDVRPFFASSGLLAVPLRIAGGSRLKILEALSAGLPVVSTRVGAEGLTLAAGEDLVVVEDVEAMAEAVLSEMRDPRRAQQRALHGQRVVREHYDWDALAGKLERVWETCVDARPVLSS